MNSFSDKDKLKDAGLKVTPQRLIVLEAMSVLKNHPTADEIISYVRNSHPNIATGTVYKVLDTFEEKNLISKVKTEAGIFRYDGITEHHHHLYCLETERIEDFFDKELDDILNKYFEKKKPDNFKIGEIKLQINGKFLD
jgi:Fur family peroxide stress response transcriptional regulator